MVSENKMKKFEDLGCAPAPWTDEANALGEIVLTCHDNGADGKPTAPIERKPLPHANARAKLSRFKTAPVFALC